MNRAEGIRGAAFVALAILLGALAALLAPEDLAPTIWKGYTSVLVEASVPETTVLAALAAGGHDTVISAATEPVVISDWVRLESTTLSAALARLVPGDPRLDHYLRSLPSWFDASVEGIPFKAYYLPARRGAFPPKDVGACLAGIGVRFLPVDGTYAGGASKDTGAALASLAIMVCAVVAIPLAVDRRARGDRRPGSAGFLLAEKIFLRVFLAAPWAILGTRGAAASALSAFAVVAACDLAEGLDLPLDEYRRTRKLSNAVASLSVRGIGAPWLVFCVPAAAAIAPGLSVPSLLCTAGSILSLAGYASWSASAGMERRRFIPRPIMRGRPPLRPGGRGRSLLAAGAALGWILLAAIPSAARSPEYEAVVMPRPVPLAGEPLPSIARITSSGSSTGGGIPTLADWLVHRARQEALPLERFGEPRPDPFAPVLVAGPDGTEAALSFDESWARAAYRSIPRLSVEGMLMSQGGAFAARSEGIGSRRSRPLATFEWLLYIILLIIPLWRFVAGSPAARSGAADERRQEA